MHANNYYCCRDNEQQMLVSDRDIKVSAPQCITSSCNHCSSLVRLWHKILMRESVKDLNLTFKIFSHDSLKFSAIAL